MLMLSHKYITAIITSINIIVARAIAAVMAATPEGEMIRHCPWLQLLTGQCWSTVQEP